MNINTLKVFSDLVRYTSFSKAAQANHISQSAVSQQIKTIEANFNVNLFRRDKKSLQLTQEGIIFHKYCQQILTTYDSMLADIKRENVRQTDNISIITNYWIGTYVLLPLIKDYFQKFQNLRIDINYINQPTVYKSSTVNHFPLYFFESPIIDPMYKSTVFTDDNFVIIGAKKSTKPKHSLTIDNINRLKMLGFDKQHPLRKIFEQTTAQIPSLNIHYDMEFNHIELIKQAILACNKTAFLPERAIRFALDLEQFQIEPSEIQPLTFPLYLSYSIQSPLSTGVKQFLSTLGIAPRPYPVFP